MKKIMTIALMILMLISIAYANYDLKVIITNIEENNSLDIRNIQIIEKNPYYLAYSGNQEYNRPFELEFIDMSGKVILKTISNYPPFTEINYTHDFLKTQNVNVYRNETLLYSKPVTFCNNNGICEPCADDDCNIFENEIVCGDCQPSSSDGFCRIEEDNICDPDCTGYVYDVPPDGCFEESLKSLGCGFYDMVECPGDETCIRPLNTGDITCCNECLKDNLDVKENTCSDFGFPVCSDNEFCDKDELTLFSNQTCCTGTCEQSDYYDKNILDSNTDRPLSIWTVIAFAVFALLVFLLGKKKLVHIAIFSIIMVSGIYVASIGGGKITGKVVESREEQMQKICMVAKEYDLPGSMLLTIAKKESGINHYKDGSVMISTDGGVGIMQIDRGDPQDIPSGPFYACGKSRIDGRELDAKLLVDNIECGALELWQKCDAFDCLNNQKEYSCANEGTGLPPKKVYYKGWDLAIRAYNGWGCGSNYYLNIWGLTDPRYINLISRIQSYVEDFHTLEENYKTVCADDVPSVPSEPGSPLPEPDYSSIPEELLKGDKMGYYYLNPSFRVDSDISIKKINDEVKFSSTLIKESLECKKSGASGRDCVISTLAKYDKVNWYIDGCPGEYISQNKGNVFKFCVDTGYSINSYEDGNPSGKPLYLRFALTLNETGIRDVGSFTYDTIQDIDSSLVQPPASPKPVESPKEGKIDVAGKTLLFYGDSTTHNEFQNHFYGDDVAAYLKGKSPSTEVIISGHPTQTAKYGLDHMEEYVLGKNPDYVFMLWGINDNYDSGKDTEDPGFKSALEKHISDFRQLVIGLKEKGISPVIMTVTPASEIFSGQEYDAQLEVMAGRQRELAKELGIPIIDTRKAMQTAKAQGIVILADAVHPSAAGYKVMADEILNSFSTDTGQDETPNGNTLCSFCGMNKGVCASDCCQKPCPEDAKIIETPYFNQCQFSNNEICKMGCGPTSLKMALEYAGLSGKDTDITGLFNIYTDYALQPLIEYSCEKGVCATKGEKWQDIEKYKSAIDKGELIITGVCTNIYAEESCHEFSAGHFVLVVGYSKDYIIINDPLTEKCDYRFGNKLVISYPMFQKMIDCAGWTVAIKKTLN